jgi:hypothetical protein
VQKFFVLIIGDLYMGIILNGGNEVFYQVKNDPYYVDKTDMINILNQAVNTERRYICVSRSRRFGKSIAASMLEAYFDRSCDSRELFGDMKISETKNWDRNLNKYNVISIDTAWMSLVVGSPDDMVRHIEEKLMKELHEAYPDITKCENCGVENMLASINEKTGDQFVFVIDEWDYLFRDKKEDILAQERYVNFLRNLFSGDKSNNYVALAYITGILSIKKCNNEPIISGFVESTMANPGELSQYIGFTESEVKTLCESHGMNSEDVLAWHGGYNLEKNRKYLLFVFCCKIHISWKMRTLLGTNSCGKFLSWLYDSGF